MIKDSLDGLSVCMPYVVFLRQFRPLPSIVEVSKERHPQRLNIPFTYINICIVVFKTYPPYSLLSLTHVSFLHHQIYWITM